MRNAAFFFLMCVLVIFTNTAAAQSADEMPANPAPVVQKSEVTPENYKYEIGGAGGLTSGVGLSFRSWNKRWGTQYTFCPIFNGNTGSVFISLGVLKMYSIYKNRFSNLYVYGGGSLFILNSERYDNVTGHKTTTLKETGRYHLNAGIGPGIEFFKGNFGFNIMSGYAWYNSWYSGSGKYVPETNMTVECAAYYRFDI